MIDQDLRPLLVELQRRASVLEELLDQAAHGDMVVTEAYVQEVSRQVARMVDDIGRIERKVAG